MRLKRITITGADDSISPADLVDLSAKYPFVEWGLLLSQSRTGSNRFPSRTWIQTLSTLTKTHKAPTPVHVSAHLCGAWLEKLCMGQMPCQCMTMEMFERIQLDFNAQSHKFAFGMFLNRLQELQEKGKQVIFQADGVNDVLIALARRAGIKVQALFDRSHGNGKSPKGHPTPLHGIHCGYAGGIGPGNLEAEITRISTIAANRSVWLDMETKVRSENGRLFDLKKVETCLKIAKSHITQGGGNQ